jgi:1-phosphatidylinositol-3-phosphate 5-kinase
MTHLKIMLRQMLLKEKIPNIREWEETLLKLALRIAKELAFTPIPYRQGEDMDVRRYIKIKKIPGGRPCDSEHVNGAVITKNVAHKQMSRSLNNPRIMLVTFPLEFHRVEGQYMQFGQILRQEREYLGNLASRIAGLRPHVVLVEKTVSRLALDALVKHNIVVARNVKSSAISTIARMTQGDEFSSIDKLAIEPRLGHCARFRLQAFDHPLIPERRKTYMRFEGCNSDLGCTIILRGGDIETLRRVKRVTCFLTFIVRNLKLETHLWKDSVISLPSFNPEAIPLSLCKRLGLRPKVTDLLQQRILSSAAPHLKATAPALPGASSASSSLDDEDDIDPDIFGEEAEQIRLSRRIDQSLEPYRTTFISVSATLRFTPPFPVLRMKELDDELHTAKRAWEDDVVLKEEKPPIVPTSEAKQVIPRPDLFSVEDPHRADIIAQIEALDVPVSLTPEQGSPRPDEDESCCPEALTAAPVGYQPSSPGKSPTEEPPETLKTVANIALESNYRHLKWKHEEHHRIWEWYLRKNPDDFEVEKYQQIFLREYTVPTPEIGQHRACFIPHLIRMQFYGENDLTLGQFIEKAVMETLGHLLDSKAICEGKSCDKPLARHCKVYVHNETRLFVAVEQWDGQIVNRTFGPAPDLITTWSACRVCGSATPFIPVSPEMQRYSFAKFLELHFYPADVKLVQGAGCEHNIYQHHIRYFASRGMTVRFQTDPAVMHDIVFPPFRVQVRHETLLEIKNSDFEKLQRSNFNWYSNLIDELKFICIDAATGDEEIDARLNMDVNSFIARAEAERADIRRLINKTYRESAPTDTLALNRVHAYRQDKIVALQQDFDRLPKPKPVTILDKATRRTSALMTMWPTKPHLGLLLDPSLSSVLPSETEEDPYIKKLKETDHFASSASEVSDSEPDPLMHDSEKNIGMSVSEVLTPQKPEELEAPTSLATKGSLKFQNSGVGSDSTVGTNSKETPIDGLPRVAPVSCLTP